MAAAGERAARAVLAVGWTRAAAGAMAAGSVGTVRSEAQQKQFSLLIL